MAKCTLSSPSIVIVGSNHECASVDLRERLAFTGDTLTGGLRVLREHVREGLILSTCNRTELYVVSDGDAAGRDQVFQFLTRYHDMPAHVLDRVSYAHSGEEAVRHLFRVASGLDSMVLGEPQILTKSGMRSIRPAPPKARDHTCSALRPMRSRLASARGLTPISPGTSSRSAMPRFNLPSVSDRTSAA